MKRDKIITFFAFLLLVVAIGVSSYNVWSTLTFSLLPPGDLTPIGLIGLKAFSRGSGQALGYGVAAFFPAILYKLGVNEFNALSAVATLMFALIPLTIAYISWIISRSRVAASIAGFLSAFFPIISQPAFTGDYPLLAAVALTSLSLSLFLHFFFQPCSKLLAGALLACAFTLFADASTPIVMMCPLILWAFISWREKDAKKLYGFLTALMFTVGLGVFLIPFNVGGYTIIVRNRLLEPSLYAVQASLLLLGLTAVAGLISLYFVSKRTAICLLGWLTPLTILAYANGVQYLLFAAPVLLAVCSHPLTRFSDIFKLLRQTEDVVLELRFERLLAAVLIILLVLTTIFYYPSAMQAYCTSNTLSEEEIAAIKTTSEKLQGLVGEEQLLAAPPRVAAWLGAFAGLSVVAPVTEEERWKLDTFTSTAFRLMNPYMMMDEWQPFSSTRSPFIYSYDGRIYAFILHVDDGTNAMNVVESNITWHEDMHGLKLMNYSWLETTNEITLIIDFWKRGFNVTKTISLAKNEAQLSISYHIVPNKGVELVNMTLPVYIEGRQRISNSSGDDWIQLDMPHVKVRFTYEGASAKPVLVYSNVQDFVVVNFTARDGVIKAHLKITLLNPQRSSEPVRYTSFFDLIKKWPVGYLMSYVAPEGLLFLQDELEKPVEVLEIIDSFNRVILNHENVNYVEAPADAMALSESVDGQNRSITYQTAGLIIHKKVNVTYDAVGVYYEVVPSKGKTRLVSMTLSLWVPWTRSVFSQENSRNALRLVTDAGNYTIRVVKGNVTFLGLGPDPEFKQPRVQIQIPLNPAGDAVEVKIEAEGAIQADYNASGRPMMSGSDKLRISLYRGIFSPLYQDQTFALYNIVPP